MSYLENDPNNFILVLKLNHVKKISRGGWSGFGMETVGIHPNDFGVLNGHPNKIPTNEMLGDVVKNCLNWHELGICMLRNEYDLMSNLLT